MKWFYNLKGKWRTLIAVAAWVVTLAFCGVIGGSIGENGENMQVWQEIIVIVLLAISIVFTVFAVKAANKDKKEKSAQATEQKAVESTPPQHNTPLLPCNTMTALYLYTQRLSA